MKLLSQIETISLLKKYKLPIIETKIVNSSKEAATFSSKIGYPVVFKIESPDVIHKSDVGGVITNIKDSSDAEVAYYKIIENITEKVPNAKIEGILIQKQVKGREILVGMKRDEQFGPVIIFGLGGVFVEVLKDVSRRILPITKKDAIDMIEEIKSKNVLEGFRGEKPVDKNLLVDIILKISELSLKEKNVLEIDFNPIISNDKNAIIVDARVIINE